MVVKYQDQHDRVDPDDETKASRVCAHTLDVDTKRISSHASGRYIPTVLHDLGFSLEAVCTSAQVHEGLQKAAK